METTREEAIEILDDGEWWGYLEEWYETENPEYVKLHDAVDMAIAALNAQAEAEKNEPLTLDELKGIRREPVFIEYLKVDLPGEWKIIRFISDREVGFTDGTSLYLPDSSQGVPCYGKTWIAYRHKPENGRH